jgi:pyruvate,water dikinase
MAPNIVWLSSKDAVSPQQLGGKGNGLHILTNLGLPVPSGFILTTAFFATNGSRNFSANQKAKILAAYHLLGQQIDEAEPAVAIRSSAIAEDGNLHSYAGIHDSFLWVDGFEEVLNKISCCRNSLFSERAKMYRSKIEETAVPQMAVIVQAMVPAQTSGVMMTLNPSNGDRSKIVIESTWGLGQMLVDGSIIPDRFLIDKVTNQLIETKLARKTKQLQPQLFPNSGVSTINVAANRQEIPSLTQEEIEQLADYGRQLEAHFSIPQDIEFATNKNNIFILQSRPETVWSQKKRQPFGLTTRPVEQIIATLTNFGKK